MTTEDYCSYELSQLLKEKGFDGVCEYAYSNKGNYFEVDRSNFDEVYCLRPTHQMAMKWLRDIYSISIEPYCYEYGWYCGFSQLPKGITIYTSQESKEYGTYEEVVEAALKYSLENLI